jgi:hypothetical protein
VDFSPLLVHEYCVLELQKLSKPGFPDFLLVIDHGKKCGPLILELFGVFQFSYSRELDCCVSKSSKALNSGVLNLTLSKFIRRF